MLRSFILVLALLALGGCVTAPQEPAYQASKTSLPMGQSSFNEYSRQTRQWLANNRLFLTQDRQAELNANTPSETWPTSANGSKAKKGILLVHGLSDSPYSFIDITPVLTSMGFHVRTVLLQGHGSRPADLLNADADEWRELVKQQVALLKPEVESLYLGGFSTGGNLVTSYAMNDDDIQGLILFSPGFKSDTEVAKLSTLVPVFSEWLYAPGQQDETNFVRYMVTPSNGFAQFYDTSAEVRFRLKKKRYEKPVFMALSEADSIIDVKRVLKLFSNRFTNPNNRLIWFGKAPETIDERVIVFAGKVPEYNISNYSHMGVLFRPTNGYYGKNGSQRICENGQVDNKLYQQCLNGGQIWYSAWGHVESGKHHARLTFNPWFDQMVEVLKGVFE